jgi:uncharacterized protein YdeI (YjbR/CyaY-like superfamily)
MPGVERHTVECRDAAEFASWLETNHAVSPGIWLKISKKGVRDPERMTVTYAEAVELALCYGWIDGQRRGLDGEYFLQGFSPRRARSIWSKRNVEAATGLIERGLMRPAGQAEIDRAKADGRWAAAYEGQAKAEIPADFLAELAKNPAAEAFFATLNSQNRYAVCFRLATAKTEQTRARRIAKFVAMFAEGKPLH